MTEIVPCKLCKCNPTIVDTGAGTFEEIYPYIIYCSNKVSCKSDVVAGGLLPEEAISAWNELNKAEGKE